MENVKNGEINALLEDLVDFANSNEYQHPSYKAYADDFCNSFNRLVAELQTNEQKEVLEKIYNDFYLEIVTIVDHFNRRPDREIKTLENRYRKLKQLILNGIALEPKKQTIYQTQQDKNKAEEEIKSFEDLFHDSNLIDESLDVLRNAEPPLIDKKDNWIGKPRGAICVWTDELKTRGIMKRADGKILSKYLPSKIKDFSISESMFRKHQNRAEDDYRLQFKSAISKIKTT